MGDRRASIKIEFSMHGKTKKADMWINWSPSDYDGVDQRVLDFFSEAAQDGKCKLCVDGCIACDARAQPAQEPVATMKMLHTYGDTTPPQPEQKPMHPQIQKMYEDYFDKCFRESSALDAAVLAEREACAKVCESYLSESPHSWGGTTTAAAIRARGNT
jgi:hypothetical protein